MFGIVPWRPASREYLELILLGNPRGARLHIPQPLSQWRHHLERLEHGLGEMQRLPLVRLCRVTYLSYSFLAAGGIFVQRLYSQPLVFIDYDILIMQIRILLTKG